MQAVRRRDTKPELLLRRELHARGLRYRVDAPVPGLPRRRVDVLFTRVRIAVLVHGCFWHACPVHGTSAATNAEAWADKLIRNQARDADTQTRLQALGYLVIVVWEHEEPAAAAAQIESAVRARSGHEGNSGKP